VKKLIKILGGNIQLKSIVGEGSSFYFSLDFPISTSESQLEDKPLVKYDASKLMNKRFLWLRIIKSIR
jgi:hypothetical protein